MAFACPGYVTDLRDCQWNLAPTVRLPVLHHRITGIIEESLCPWLPPSEFKKGQPIAWYHPTLNGRVRFFVFDDQESREDKSEEQCARAKKDVEYELERKGAKYSDLAVMRRTTKVLLKNCADASAYAPHRWVYQIDLVLDLSSPITLKERDTDDISRALLRLYEQVHGKRGEAPAAPTTEKPTERPQKRQRA